MRSWLLLFATLFPVILFGQFECLNENAEQFAERLKTDKRRFDLQYAPLLQNAQRSGLNFAPNSIPVKIHILQDLPGNGRSVDSNGITAVINRLNSDFANVGLEFYKCGNINYITNSAYNDMDYYSEFTPLYNTSAVVNVVNIYFVRNIMLGGSMAAGVAPTPGGRDFVLMRGSDAVGNITHEMGHYFGLLHTHGVSNTTRSKEKVDGSNCTEEGDFFCDTPADPGLLNVVFTNCVYTGTWGDANGQGYSPDVANHMSYAPANCRNRFSNEQTAFMNWTYHEYRSYLQCSSINIDFSINATQVCDSPFAITFTNTSMGLNSFQWDVNDDNITDYTATNATHSFGSSGVKYIHLKGLQAGKTYHRHKRVELFDAKAVPAYESFNSATLQDGWRFADMDGGRSWELVKAIGPDGQYSNTLCFRNYAYESATAEDQVFSTGYDLTGLQNARLTFDIAYAPSAKSDTLKIYISTNCGKTYSQLIYRAFNDSLKSVNKTYAEFIPTADSWKSVTINLTPYINSYVRFKIENVNKAANNIYIDNFRVDGGTAVKEVGFVTGRNVFYESNATIPEGCRKYRIVQVPLYISAAPSAIVTAYVSAAGNAQKVHDYLLLDSLVTFAVGSTANKYVRLKVYDDASVEAVESIVLTITQVSGNGFTGSARSSNSVLYIYDNEPGQPALAVLDTLLLNATFNNETTWVPSGWSIASDCPYCPATGVVDSMLFWCTTGAAGGWFNGTESLDSSDFVIMWALEAYKGVPLQEYLITPSLDASGYDSVILSFDNVFERYPDIGFEKIGVQVWNGSQWVSVWSHIEYNGDLGKFYQPYRKTINISSYANANLKVRFSFTNADYGYYWAIDNVKIQGWRTGYKVATLLNTTASGYLAPNDTIHLISNRTLMATLANQSNWNYGCTNIAIDRAGTGALAYELPAADYFVSEKTVLITPSHNNPAGNYDITLYYTQAEMNGWVNATGNQPQQISLVKTGGAIKNITPANPSANGATNCYSLTQQLRSYNSDWQLSGNFITGFSGFGAGLPPSSGLLPVDYLEPLAGRHEQGTCNILTWTTALEINNDYFNLQRSTDGIDFTPIAIIDGQGNATIEHNYSYIDNNYKTGINYYRLMQVDFDGHREFSNIAAVNAQLPEVAMQIYPNPASDVVNVILSAEQGMLTIVDELGNAVLAKPVQGSTTRFYIANLPKGVYTISLRNGAVTKNMRLVKI